jgi:GTPase Era involved in 16S rRNA processing
MDNPKIPLIERAKEIVLNSRLKDEDKKLVTDQIPYAPTALLEMFIESCSGDALMLEFMVRSLKRKLVAGDNQDKIRAILKEERTSLRKLAHA